MGRTPKREYSNGRCLIRKSKNLNHSLTNSKHRIPHQRQNLIATTGFVVLLFLLQVSLSDLPHLPASCEALRSQNFPMPTISKVSLYIWQRYQRWGEGRVQRMEHGQCWNKKSLERNKTYLRPFPLSYLTFKIINFLFGSLP